MQSVVVGHDAADDEGRPHVALCKFAQQLRHQRAVRTGQRRYTDHIGRLLGGELCRLHRRCEQARHRHIEACIFQRGRHDIRVGADLRWYQLNAVSPPNPTGSFAFTTTGTDSQLKTSVLAFGGAERYDVLLRPTTKGTYTATVTWEDWITKKPLKVRQVPIVVS